MVRRPDGRDRAGQDRGPHALGMMRRENGGEQAAKGKSDQDRLLDLEASITARASAR